MSESTCPACGVTDDAPRHVFASFGSDQAERFHFTCCASRGCPTCQET